MLLVVGVVVVGGEDAFAVAEEGQAVAGELGYEGAAVLVALVAQCRLGVLEQGVELCTGGSVLDGAGDGAQEVAAGAGDVVEGDGDLSAGVTALGGEGDAFAPLATGPWGSGSLPLLGLWAVLLLGVAVLLPLGVVPPVGVRVISTRRLAARAWSVVSLILGWLSPLPDTLVFHLSRLVSCSRRVLTALARLSERVWL